MPRRRADDKSPAFQYYPKDLLSDPNVLAMTLEEFGAYWKLVSLCWIQRTLPADLERLAKMLQVTPDKMREMWDAIGTCFVPDRRDDARIFHPRLEKEWRKQLAYRAKQHSNGKLGGRPKKGLGFSGLPKQNPKKPLQSAICNLQSATVRTPALTRGERSASGEADPLFATFWESYPRRTAKKAALKAWAKLKPDPPLLDRMLAAIARQKASAAWQKDGGEYIPHPATWLNGERWTDQPAEVGGRYVPDEAETARYLEEMARDH